MALRTYRPRVARLSSTIRSSLRAFLAVSVFAASAAVASSCSLVIDGDAESCTEDADCVNHPGLTKCDTEAGVCITPDTCTSNTECADGEICTFVSPRACRSLLSERCATVYPDDPAIYLSDDSILIGVTAPLTEGGEASSTGVSILNSAILAVSEINQSGGANGQRPMALLACDDTGDSNLAEANGQTLADLGIQAILGPAFSGQTLAMTKGTPLDPDVEGDIGSDGTVKRGVLNMSSSATSTEITGIKDEAPSCAGEEGCPGLVWRTSPSDLIQGAAMVEYFPALQDIALARVEPPRTQVKVVILHKGDSYGRNLANFVQERLLVNGKLAINNSTDALKLDYGDTSQAGVEPDADIIQQAIDFRADVYILIGTNELGTATDPDASPGVMQQIEEGWSDPTANSEPYYLFADGGLIAEVENAATTTGARLRVRGTVPGTKGEMTSPVGLYSGRYDQMFPGDEGAPTVFGGAGAYDTIYLLAYSVAAANGAPMTGEQFARGLLRMNDGEGIEVGPPKFGSANNTLQNGGSINFIGASGPLDFDVVAGEAESDIQIWCINSSNKGEFSGLFYSASFEGMEGDDDVAGECPFP